MIAINMKPTAIELFQFVLRSLTAQTSSSVIYAAGVPGKSNFPVGFKDVLNGIETSDRSGTDENWRIRTPGEGEGREDVLRRQLNQKDGRTI